MYKSKSRRWSTTSRSMTNSTICDNPGTGSAPSTSFPRKVSSSWPYFPSRTKDHLSSFVHCKRAIRVSNIPAKSSLVPRTSATDQDGCKGSNLTIASCESSIHRGAVSTIPWGCDWVKPDFTSLIWGGREKVKTILSFSLSPYFGMWCYYLHPYKGKKYIICLVSVLIWTSFNTRHLFMGGW